MKENPSVLGTLCSSYDTYFDAERKIADYILENKADVIDMTVAELAKASGASDATVSRFCRKCGFKGFQNLKMALAQDLAEERQKSEFSSAQIDRHDLQQSIENILNHKIMELKQTFSMIVPEKLDEILSILEQAGTVQFAAVGNTIPIAMDGTFKFNQIGITALTATIWEAQLAYTFNLKKNDVVVVISNSGASKRLCTLIKGAKENGAIVISITNNRHSPIAEASDYHITTATREKLLLGDFYFSKVSALMIIEMLYVLMAAGRKDSYDSISRHEMALSEDRL